MFGWTFLQSSACSLPQTHLCDDFFFLLLLYSNCLSALSLSFLSCLFPSSLLSSAIFLNFSVQLPSSLLICHWYPGLHPTWYITKKHNTICRHTLMPTFSKKPTDPTSPAACGSPNQSRFGEKTPGLWGRKGWPGCLSFPTLPTLWAHAAFLHR